MECTLFILDVLVEQDGTVSIKINGKPCKSRWGSNKEAWEVLTANATKVSGPTDIVTGRWMSDHIT